MSIQFVDLKAQFESIKDEIRIAIDSVINDMSFVQGPYMRDFENHFCEAHGVRHGVGCANGTVAITAALRVLGIGPGDEVVLPANTFFATAEAVVEVGATPVLCDIDPKSYGVDPISMERSITPKTRAFIPVHLYGAPVNMSSIVEIAKTNKIAIVEDCAQAHLASYKGQPVGSFGEFGTFSFYPGKNLGAYGDAGFVVSSSQENANLFRKYIDHGRVAKYEHDIFGTNYRMDGLQAAILSVKTKYLKDWTERRQTIARTYDESLKGTFKVVEPLEEAPSVYHLYVVEVKNREEVMTKLKGKNISTGIHYPIPLTRQPAFMSLGYKGTEAPLAEAASERIMSLPIFPEMTEEQVSEVLREFRAVAKP